MYFYYGSSSIYEYNTIMKVHVSYITIIYYTIVGDIWAWKINAAIYNNIILYSITYWNKNIMVFF